MRGSNEPDMSMRRKNALNHFLREIEGFTLDHEYEAGPEWDEKIKGFRHGLESILGNGPGSVMVKGEAGANANIGQDNLKGMGGPDSIAGLNVNG
jgi:SMODS and SLOG-associating 2TM effector domain